MAGKAAVEITIDSSEVATGDVVTGSVSLRCDKELSGDGLSISLVCESDDGEDWEGSKTWQVFHVEQSVLHGPHVWPAGTEKSFPFSLPVPAPAAPAVEVDPDAGLLKRRAQKKTIKAHANLKTRYRLEAELEGGGRGLRDKSTLKVDGQKYRRFLKQ